MALFKQVFAPLALTAHQTGQPASERHQTQKEILAMFAALARLIHPSQPPVPQRHPMIPQVIETVGGGIDQARNLEALLTPAIEHACNYFDLQIAAIPGPIDVSHTVHGQVDECTALFPEADHIGHALGRSLEVKESLPGLARSGHEHVYALLGMRHRQGDTGSNGRRPLADHTVRSLAPTESEARDYLRYVAFKRLLMNFAAHVDKLRRKERLLAVEWNIQSEISGPDTGGYSNQYVVASKELTPDNLLRGLIAWLRSPEMYFRVDSGDLAAATTALPTLHSSDRRQWLVSFIRFPVNEALQALERESHTHRYIYI